MMHKSLVAARGVVRFVMWSGVLGMLVDVATGPLPPATGLFAYAALFRPGLMPAPEALTGPSCPSSPARPSVCQATWPVPSLAADPDKSERRDRTPAVALAETPRPPACPLCRLVPAGPPRSGLYVVRRLHRLQC